MALFGFKKGKKDESLTADEARGKVAEEKAAAPAASGKSGIWLSHVLRNPRISEKATMHTEAGIYTFDVADDATKPTIARAVSSLYKVTPRKITIVTIRTKVRRSARTGKLGVTRGGKKAYVHLRKGDTITIT